MVPMLARAGHVVTGLDIAPGTFTDTLGGSVANSDAVAKVGPLDW